MFLSLWLILILLASVIPVSNPSPGLPADKIAHFVLYGLTSVFIYTRVMKNRSKSAALSISVLMASAYGAFMELVQFFLPYRSFSMEDMTINFAGALICCIIYSNGKQKTA